MFRGHTTLLVFVGALALSACTSVAKEPSAARPRALPQFGLRIVSAPESLDLMPTPTMLATHGSNLASAPLAALPLGYPRVVNPQLENTNQISSSPETFFLANYSAPAALPEVAWAGKFAGKSPAIAETRFQYELAPLFLQELSDSWSDQFRLVMESTPTRGGVYGPLETVVSDDPFLEERNHSAWLRGQKKFNGAFRGSAKDTKAGAPVMEQLRDWRNQPLNLVLAIAGGGLEQETPEGGKLILGPQLSELAAGDNPAELFKVRYVFGPFEARAQTRETWARYRADLFGCSLLLRTSYSYLRQKQTYQASVGRFLGPRTELNLVGGSGLGSETMTGYSPYPNDPREDRRVAIFLVLDHRF